MLVYLEQGTQPSCNSAVDKFLRLNCLHVQIRIISLSWLVMQLSPNRSECDIAVILYSHLVVEVSYRTMWKDGKKHFIRNGNYFKHL